MGELTPQETDETGGNSAGHADVDAPYVPGERSRNSWVAPGSSGVVHIPPASQDDEHPNRGRRLLARIPGLASLTEQSGWVGEGTQHAPGDDLGWVFHEGGGPEAFEGWLYHYADGTMVDAEGTEYADPDAVAAEPETPPEPEPEPEPEPVAVTAEPDPEPEPTAAEPVAPSDIPRFVEYSPTHTRGYLLGTIFVVAAVTGVLTIFVGVSESSASSLVIAAGCFLLAVVAWWGLLSWRPTVVSIEEGVLEITRSDRTERFELTDPATVVEFAGRPGSPTWTATVRNHNGPRTLLRPSQVKPRQFERIVRHHRARAQAPRPDGAATS